MIDPELTTLQRLLVAGTTFRPSRARWAERFFKSNLGFRLRSGNARRGLTRLGADGGAVVQVHALFEVPGARRLIYVDCTLDQAADGWPAWVPMRGTSRRTWRRRELAAYRDAVHLFAFNTATRESLISGYGVPPDRVTVVGIGVNVERLPEPSPSVPAHPPTILFVGHDFVRKGGRVLVEAFRIVRRSVPTARLQLVGADPQIAPEPGVEVLGRIDDRAEIERRYASASVFCLPTAFDPGPLVVLEAMAHGVPVVTTPTGCVPDLEVSGDEVVIVCPGDPQALAAALVGLLTDPEHAEKIGLAGRRRVEQYWTWERVVQRMAPALERALRT